jgi:MerR family mercuric resistance operon transcriptional regulator
LVAPFGDPAASAMPIGALSRHTGCNIETIRYYERVGLLPAPPRSAGGHRIYGVDHLKRLTFIRRGRQLGFTLKDVRGLLALVDGGGHTCDEVQVLTLAHLGEVRRKIADLKVMEGVLGAMAAECEGGTVPACPVIEALFRGA